MRFILPIFLYIYFIYIFFILKLFLESTITKSSWLLSNMVFQFQVVKNLQDLYGDMYSLRNVIITGTHTHAAPGGYLVDFLLDVSILGFSSETFNAYVAGITRVRYLELRNHLEPIFKLDSYKKPQFFYFPEYCQSSREHGPSASILQPSECHRSAQEPISILL